MSTINRTEIAAVGDYVLKASPGSLPPGTPVYYTGGTNGGYNLVERAVEGVTPPATLVLSETATDVQQALGLTVGRVAGVNTTAFVAGDALYVDGAGALTDEASPGRQEVATALVIGVSGSIAVHVGQANMVTRTALDTWAHVKPLAVDPAVANSDVWVRDDFRIGMQLGGVKKYAWFDFAPFAASWDPTLCGYFLVDNENGDDTRDGVVYAAPGATIDPTNKAIRTIERLMQVWPKLGAGRTCVVLLKGRAAGSFLNQALGAAEFSPQGVFGYNRLVIRGSTDLTNSAADQLTCGGRTAAGFEPAGYNITPNVLTISGVTNATPVQVSTTAPHGRATGDQVQITGVVGQASANGEYTVTVTGANTFTLNNTRATIGEAYTSGGSATFYVATRVAGGGAAAFPAQSLSTGYRLRFDAATATVALRNSCYEIFTVGGDTVIPGRLFAAAPTGADVVYVEEAGVQIARANISLCGAARIVGLNSSAELLVQGADGMPSAANFSLGNVSVAFCQAVTTLGIFGPCGQAAIVNTYVNEAGTTVTVGGTRAREFAARQIQFFSMFRGMAFGTTSPNNYNAIALIATMHTLYSQRGMDILNCGAGVAGVGSGSFSGSPIGRAGISTARRIRLGGSAHNASINLVGSSLALYGIFFDGSTQNCVQPYGVGGSTAMDDCVGSATADVPGIDLSTSAREWRVSIGVVAPCSIAGSGNKQIQLYSGQQFTYADIAVAEVNDTRGNRVSGSGGIRLEARANWSLTSPRFYAVDPVSGSDTAKGYSDVSLSAAGAVALKTLEELYERMPKNGCGRSVMIGLAAGTYLKKDEATADRIKLLGLNGYTNITFRGTQFLDTLADKHLLAGTVAVPGPNGDGSWTVGSITGLVVTVAGGSLPVDRSAHGWRVRWKGNVTAGAATEYRGLQQVLTTSTFDLSATVTVATGDEFFIDKPSVIVDGVEGGGSNAYHTLGSVRGVSLAGIEFSLTDAIAGQPQMLDDGASLAFCSFPNGVTLRSPRALRFNGDYRDETGALISMRHSARVAKTFSYVSHGQGVNGLKFLFVIGDTLGAVSFKCFNAGGLDSFLAGSYIYGQANITGSGMGVSQSAGNSDEIGNGPSGSAFAPLQINGSLLLRGVRARVYGVGINNSPQGALVIGGNCHLSIKNVSGTGNTGAGIDFQTTPGLGSHVVIEDSTVTVTGAGGEIQASSFTVTYADLALFDREDTQGNRIIGAAGSGVTRRTQGTINNVPLLAADPTSPVAGDLWARDDSRLGGRMEGVNKYAWFTQAPAQADWALATTRYYAVDFVGGSDTNRGYSDASMAAAGAVAVKTLTQLKAILPANGAGRAVVIAVKGPTANTAAAISYLKPDNVTLDDLDLRAYGNYRYALVRTTQDFSNTATDKVVCAPVLGQVGPNGDSSFTIAGGGTVNTFSVSAGTLTAKPGLYAMRVRFSGNVTAALANQSRVIWKNSSSQIILGMDASVAPVAGDTFWVERPGVIVDQFYSPTSSGAGNGSGFNSTLVNNVVGFRCTQSTNVTNFINGADLTLSCSFMEFDSRLSMGTIGSVAFRESYVDEAGGTVTPGPGLRWTQNTSGSIVTGDVTAQLQLFCSSLVGGSATSCTIQRLIGVGVLFCGGYCSKDLNIQSGKTAGGHGILVGNAAASNYRRAYFDNAYVGPGQSCGVEIRGLDTNACAGKPSIKFQSVVHGTLQLWDDIVSTDGGNTDVLIDVGGYQFNTLLLGVRGGVITATATLGDIRTADGTIVSIASINSHLTVDTNGNTYVGPTGATRISRRTPGIIHNVPRLAADPASPLAGDIWARDDARLGAVLDGVTKYAWFGKSASEANWATNLCRYFVVDYTNGVDTNDGYVDATPGSTFSAATLQAVAVKTFEELYSRIPKSGADRIMAILVRGYSSPVTYLKKDGVTTDDVNLQGVSGYKRIVCRTSDFTNNTADKVNLATYIFLAGPNGDQSFTVSAVTGNTITVTGTGLTTGTALVGKQVRWETGALAGVESHTIQRVIDASNFVIGRLPTAPAIGATLTIRHGSAHFSQMLRGNDTAHGAPDAQTSLRGLQHGGFHYVKTGGVRNYIGEQDNYYMVSFAGNMLIEQVSGRAGFGSPSDEAGTTISTRGGPAFLGGLTTVGAGGNWDLTVVVGSTNQWFNLQSSFSLRAFGFYTGTALFNGGGSLHDTIPTANTTHIGTPATAGYANGYADRAIRLRGIMCAMSGVSIATAASPGAVQIQGTCNVALNNILDGGGNVGYGIEFSSSEGSVVRLVAGNTVTGTLGDIGTVGGVVTYAQLAYIGFKDTSNRIIGSAKDESAQGILCTASGAVALGDNVRISASATVTKAQADTAANASHVTGCVQNAAANGAPCMVIVGGVGLMRFNASPSAPNIAYLSEAVAGEAKTTAPASGGTNQILRMGKVLRPISGQPLAVASIRPEYEPVTA